MQRMQKSSSKCYLFVSCLLCNFTQTKFAKLPEQTCLLNFLEIAKVKQVSNFSSLKDDLEMSGLHGVLNLQENQRLRLTKLQLLTEQVLSNHAIHSSWLSCVIHTSILMCYVKEKLFYFYSYSSTSQGRNDVYFSIQNSSHLWHLWRLIT